MGTANADKKLERQKGLVSVAEKSKNNALNDVALLRGRVAVADTHEAEIFSNSSKVSS